MKKNKVHPLQAEEKEIKRKKAGVYKSLARGLGFDDNELLLALLMHSTDELKASLEDSSREANKLSSAIKNLTWALVIIGGLTIIIMIGTIILRS
jgi:hypothetical protein